MSSGSIHVVLCDRIFFQGQTIPYCMCKYFIYSPVDTWDASTFGIIFLNLFPLTFRLFLKRNLSSHTRLTEPVRTGKSYLPRNFHYTFPKSTYMFGVLFFKYLPMFSLSSDFLASPCFLPLKRSGCVHCPWTPNFPKLSLIAVVQQPRGLRQQNQVGLWVY